MQLRLMVMEGGGKVLFSWSLRVGNVGLLLGFCSRAPLRILEDIATDSLRPDVVHVTEQQFRVSCRTRCARKSSLTCSRFGDNWVCGRHSAGLVWGCLPVKCSSRCAAVRPLPSGNRRCFL